MSNTITIRIADTIELEKKDGDTYMDVKDIAKLIRADGGDYLETYGGLLGEIALNIDFLEFNDVDIPAFKKLIDDSYDCDMSIVLTDGRGYGILKKHFPDALVAWNDCLCRYVWIQDSAVYKCKAN